MKKQKVVNNGKTYFYEKQQLVLDVSAYQMLKEFSKENNLTLSKAVITLIKNYRDLPN